MSLDAKELLARGLAHAKEGHYAEARVDRDAALKLDANARVRLVAAVLSARVREYDRALREALRVAEMDTSLASQSLAFAMNVASRLTWSRDVAEIARRGVALGPEHGRPFTEALLRESVGGHEFDRAIGILRSSPYGNTAEGLLEIARLCLRIPRFAQAERVIDTCLALPGLDLPIRLQCSDLLSEAGAFEKAEGLLQNLSTTNDSSDITWRLARLRLWNEDDPSAKRHAERALAADDGCGPAWRTLGVLRFRAAQFSNALPELNRALEIDPKDVEALVWRARVHLKLNNIELGQRDLGAIQCLGNRTSIAADLVRRQYYALSGQRGHHDESVLPFLQTIVPDAGQILAKGDNHSREALFRTGIEALGANCSAIMTTRRAGRLERIHAPPVREQILEVLEGFRLVDAEEIKQRIADISERFPTSALCRAYQGEVRLWLGDVNEARHWLNAALERTVYSRWSYIGLAICDLVEGKAQAALDMLALGVARMHSAGPAVYGNRAEAHRLLGQFDDARRDLAADGGGQPSRLSAWINLGLLEGAVGNEPGLSNAFKFVRERAPGLVSDAADEAGISAWENGDALPSRESQIRLLDHALRMMRGNRSSGTVTYFHRDHLRFLMPHPSDVTKLDANDEQLARRLLDSSAPFQRR